MELLWRVFVLLVFVQGSFSVRVTLESGQTGMVAKKALENDTVILGCSATTTSIGGGTPSLEWTYSTDHTKEGIHVYYRERVTPGLDRVSIRDPYSLEISDLVSADSGYYKCRVVIPGDTPSADSATYNFTVVVPPYPQISCGFPEDFTITLGTSTEFRCQQVVDQAAPAPTYKWFKNNRELPLTSAGNSSYSNSNFLYSPSTGILNFWTVTASDEGEYYCVASNEAGSRSCGKATIKTRSFSVKVALERSQTGMVVKKARKTENVVLQCSAPVPLNRVTLSLEWTYSTDPTKEGKRLYYGGEVTPGHDRVSIQNPYSLAISNLVSSDSGYYKCRVTIPGDTPSTDEATYNFTVIVPPYSQVSCGFPGDLMITIGTSAEFRCHEVIAEAAPAPTYKWFKNDRELPLTSAGGSFYTNSSFSYSPSTGILNFSTVTASDKGEYYCTVTNEAGIEQCSKATIKTKTSGSRNLTPCIALEAAFIVFTSVLTSLILSNTAAS